ncbi:MAG: Rrf2 family transcriptional regulator [Pirellulales bacterium]|nr:Rrf2 family transcriptional regulator [Pirellulales bacterium]
MLVGNLDKSFTNRAIAERLDAPARHLAKVMRNLAEANQVHSQRGLLGSFN